MTTKTKMFRLISHAAACLRQVGSIAIKLGHRPALVSVPLLGLMLCLAGCQQPMPASKGSDAAAGATPYASSQLQEGDVVRVTFEGNTNLNTLAKVQLDGSISMPLVGDVKAAGKTLPELKNDLTTQYARLLKENEISATLVSSAAIVYVSGAVLKPGRYPMDRPLTVLDAIMEAGGYDYNRAKLSEVTVLRLENGVQKYYTVNLKRTLSGADPSPFYLKPFDTVRVPEKTFNF